MSETTPNPPTDPRDGFTPGPWEPFNDYAPGVMTPWDVIAPGPCITIARNVGEANARLIASAPTLLADNERLRKRVADLEEMLDEADDELWLTYPNGETNTPAANLRERIRAALALAGQKGNEHGT